MSHRSFSPNIGGRASPSRRTSWWKREDHSRYIRPGPPLPRMGDGFQRARATNTMRCATLLHPYLKRASTRTLNGGRLPSYLPLNTRQWMAAPPDKPTEFEVLVSELRLSPEEYGTSTALREWVRQNKEERYVPTGVLQLWGFGSISSSEN